MDGTGMSSEFRRARRRRVIEQIEVVDAMTDMVIGRLGNLSESGVLLITNTALREDALYQWRFNLPHPNRGMVQIECGAHLLWLDQASAPGQWWAGARFILLSKTATDNVAAWIESPGGSYE